MSAATIEKPPCTHREQKPVRSCLKCGAYLRSYGNGAFCDPCSKRTISTDDKAEIFRRISEMEDVRARCKAFEVLAELMGEGE